MAGVAHRPILRRGLAQAGYEPAKPADPLLVIWQGGLARRQGLGWGADLPSAKSRSDHLGELPDTFPWRSDSFRDLLCLLPAALAPPCLRHLSAP